ncbi:hypothetical protein GEMRC1_013938 [Eukaryota sp. GEM-RC1]
MSETRALKISTSAVRRIIREYEYYKTEVAQQEEKVCRLKDQGADSHDVNKQIEVLDDSRQMLPDTLRRLEAAWYTLKQTLDDFVQENPHYEGEEISLARHQLQLAEDVLPESTV